MACAPGGVLTGDATIVQAPPALPIARNTALLSAALAAHSAMGQLAVAVASITLVRVIDVDRLLGLGPAVVLAAGALAAIPAGRSMDRSAGSRCSPPASASAPRAAGSPRSAALWIPCRRCSPAWSTTSTTWHRPARSDQ